MRKPPRDQHTAQVGSRLRETIVATHKTLKAWCEEFDLSQAALNHALFGWNYPDLPTLIKYCDDYSLTLDWFFRGKEGPVKSVLEARQKETKQASGAVSPAAARQVREKVL